MIETWSVGDIPAELRKLSEAVDAFHTEVANYDDRENVDQLYPHGKFWTALKAIDKIVTEKVLAVPLRPLESIEDLAKLPNMAHEQIARMYGFFDRRGNVMPWLVQKELDVPNSVLKTPNAIDGRTWSDPRLEEEAAEELEDEEKETVSLARKKKAATEEDKPCPESIVDLWEQGVGYAQAANMLKKEEAAVKAAYATMDAGRENKKKAVKAGAEA